MEATEWLIRLRMDEHLPGTEDWDNEVCWTPEDGSSDVNGTLEAMICAAFHRDAELLDNGGPYAA